MSVSFRPHIETIFQQALAAVDAGRVVREALLAQSATMSICERSYPIPPAGVYAIALGKAAPAMLAATEAALGDKLVDALAVTKAYGTQPAVRHRVLLGSHPRPDERSLVAGEALLEFAAAIPRGALVLCLVSGGGSALAESLRTGVTLEHLQRVTEQLLRAGATINDLNAVRARLSRIKAGGLLGALEGCTVCNLVVSDVLGDPPHVIAGGPTVQPDHRLRAEDVLQRYGITISLPNITTRTMPEPAWFVLANVSTAIDAAAASAVSLGYIPFVLSRSVEGEARDVGRLVGSILTDTAAGRTSIPRPACVLAGGESTVTVRGRGVGGRNTEGALSAAIRMSGVASVAVGFLATDGDDARTGLAGAIVNGDLIGGANGSDAVRSMADNDSATFLSTLGATVRTGPTGTNVNDLIIGLVD